MLGHASAAMTLDTYADLFDDDLDAVASKLNDAMVVTNWQRKHAADRANGPRWARQCTVNKTQFSAEICAPGGIRTPDPLLRTEWLFH